MKTISIGFDVFKIIISLLGKLSYSEISKLIGENDSRKLDQWYFNNRSRTTQ